MNNPVIQENHRFDDKRGYPDKDGVNANLAPLNGLVFIEPDFGPSQTDSGILLADKRAKDIPKTGWVIAKDENIDAIEIGDYVVFNSYQAKGFWNKQVAHIPVEHDNILAIIGDKKR